MCFVSPILAQPNKSSSNSLYQNTEPAPKNLNEVIRDIEFPDSFYKKQTDGKVVAKINIDATGRYISHSIVSSSDVDLTKAVEKVLPNLQFTPATMNNKPVPASVVQPFAFSASRSKDRGESNVNRPKQIGYIVGLALGGVLGYRLFYSNK